MAISTLVQQSIKGNQATFNTGGALFGLTTTPQTVSAVVTNRKQKLKNLTCWADTTCAVIFVDSLAPTIPIYTIGLQQNVARTLSENDLQSVPQTGISGALQIQANTGTPNVVISGIADLE